MRIFLIAVFIVSGFVVQSQTRIDTIFKQLKTGGILVRLKTNENTLKALKGKNDPLAEKIIRERNKENQKIIDAFKGFTYCPIYFFYSTNSKKIIKKEFENVLLDFNLNPIQDAISLNENYLIATFDYTSKDTGSYFLGSEYRYVSIENDGRYQGERKNVDVYGSPSAFDTGVDALILFTPDFVKVSSPYPHYARTYEHLPFINWTYNDAVQKLQYKIEKFVSVKQGY